MPTPREVANSFTGVGTVLWVAIVCALTFYGGRNLLIAVEPSREMRAPVTPQPVVEVEVFGTSARRPPTSTTAVVEPSTSTGARPSTSTPPLATTPVPAPSPPAGTTTTTAPAPPMLTVPSLPPTPLPTVPELPIPESPDVTLPEVTTTTTQPVTGAPGRPCPVEGITATFHNGLALVCVAAPVVGLIWRPV